GNPANAGGEIALIPGDLSTDPKLRVEAPVLLAAKHPASTGQGGTVTDMFGGTSPLPTIDITRFTPNPLVTFPPPARPPSFEKGPFENPITANLVIFSNLTTARLGWYVLLTFPDFTDQYAVIIAADTPTGELLFSQSNLRGAAARGLVFEFSPGVGDRQ